MKYTYRYSRESTVTVSWVCPICLQRTCINSEDIPQDQRFKYKHSRSTDELCCSLKCTKEYERRIRKAIAWARDIKKYNGKVTRGHYNAIFVNTVDRGKKFTTVANVLAELGEYFPFNQEKDK